MPARNRRLPKGKAWSLTSTDVEESLGSLMDHVTGLRFLTGLNSGTIVLGAWWVPSEPFNYGRGVHPSAVGFRIDVHLVEAAQRSGLRTLLKEQALPELRELIQYGAQADPVSSWRRTEHCRYWRFEDGELSARDER